MYEESDNKTEIMYMTQAGRLSAKTRTAVRMAC